MPPYQNSENVCANQNFQIVLPYQKCESVSFNTNVSIVQSNRENHPDITDHLAFVVVSVTIFIHNVAVLLECVDYARKSDILQ